MTAMAVLAELLGALEELSGAGAVPSTAVDNSGLSEDEEETLLPELRNADLPDEDAVEERVIEDDSNRGDALAEVAEAEVEVEAVDDEDVWKTAAGDEECVGAVEDDEDAVVASGMHSSHAYTCCVSCVGLPCTCNVVGAHWERAVGAYEVMVSPAPDRQPGSCPNPSAYVKLR